MRVIVPVHRSQLVGALAAAAQRLVRDGSPGIMLVMRGQPERWENGRFIHPHDACFDPHGNIYVVEWVANGRVSFLKKVA